MIVPKRLPISVMDLIKKEKIEVKSYTRDPDHPFSYVVAKDGREYYIFKSNKSAYDYAHKVFIDANEHDENYKMQIALLGHTLKTYAIEHIADRGPQYIISYDQHHMCRLKDATAYRII